MKKSSRLLFWLQALLLGFSFCFLKIVFPSNSYALTNPIASSSCNTNVSDVSGDANESYRYKATCGDTTVYSNDKTNKTAGFKVVQDSHGRSLEFKLQSLTNQTPTISGNTLTYNFTLSGVNFNLKFTITDNKIKEEFIIPTRPSQAVLDSLPATYNFTFDLTKLGLNAVVDGDIIHFNDATTGVERFQIPKPTLTDANGNSGTISVSVTATTATVSINTSFLQTATYPVTIDPTVVIGTSSLTTATDQSTERHIVRTSDGTLHTFVFLGTQTVSCGGSSKDGLVWMYSTDAASTWTCGGQLVSTSVNTNASATVDSSDNIYVVYSRASCCGSTAFDVFYRKLTKGAGASWTLGSEQTALDSTASTTGYTYATIELEGTTRLWMAVIFLTSSTTYQVSTYYSDGLGTAPTWTVSQTTLDTASTSSTHSPVIVRFGSKIGVIYPAGTNLAWRYRNDTDALTSWVAESNISSSNAPNGSSFYAIGDSSGNVYAAWSFSTTSTTISFSYYNGSSWSSTVTLLSTGSGVQLPAFVSVATNGTNAWVFYPDQTGFNTSLSGKNKLVYKKGVPPFAAANFDASVTNTISYHGIFDKYWSFVSSSYLDDTTDAGNTTTSDTQMVTGVGDIAYFGKTEKFDGLSWQLVQSPVAGVVAWEYWNGSTWSALTLTASSNPNFTGAAQGWASFTDPSDWTQTQVDTDSSPGFYYIRARVTTAFTTSPAGSQFSSFTAINSATAHAAGGKIYTLWTENASSPTKIRFATPVSYNATPDAPTSLGGSGLVDGSFTNTTQPFLSFILSDSDSGDTVKYKIQIDDTSDFSSPVVDYTSALAAQGSASFTVGQAAGSGSYTTGSSGQTLSDASYYWRVRAVDSNTDLSSYSTANSGAVAFKVEATAPSDFDLQDPGEDSFTTNTRPTFAWKKSTDSGSGISSYDLIVDEGKTGQISITGIPKDYASSGCSGETGSVRACNKGRYSVVYENEQDQNSTNDVIKVYTNSSSLWSSSENDGALKEGKRTWRVRAKDAAGNEQASGRNLGVDLTFPTLSLDDFSGGKTYFSKAKPTFSGSLRDTKSGYEFSSSNKDKVRSNPDKVEITVEKIGFIKNTIVLVVSLLPSGTCTSGVDASTSDSCTKTFSYQIPTELFLGSYKITARGYDTAGNSNSLSFTLKVGAEEEKEAPKEETKEVAATSLEELTERTIKIANNILTRGLELTKNISQRIVQSAASLASAALGKLGEVLASVPPARKIADLVKPTLGPLEKLRQFYESSIAVAFDREPTKIINVEVIDRAENMVTVSAKTNHSSTAHINYGETTGFGKTKFSDGKAKEHTFILDGLEAGKTYYFEIIAKGKNIAIDAYRTFETPGVGEVRGLKKINLEKYLTVKGNKDDIVSLHRTPSVKSRIIGYVKGGDTLLWRNHTGNWIEVKIGKEWGWILGALTEN